ncbi:hypothetical protein NW765_016870 [Fusarium oxysporum]|nr:hypothetical protein NW765_016870 [Fusarium oxysporum]
MPARLPDVSGLLALLDRFRTPKRSGLPGGSATEEEIAFAEKDSPIKGEPLSEGFASPLMVAVSLPTPTHAGGFASPLTVAVFHPTAALSGGFTSPLMIPLTLLYPSFGKQLAT